MYITQTPTQIFFGEIILFHVDVCVHDNHPHSMTYINN